MIVVPPRPDILVQCLQVLLARSTFLALLGTGDYRSLYPRLDDPRQVAPPPSTQARPWALLALLPTTPTSSITASGGLRGTFFDDPAAPPWALNALVGEFKQAFKERRGALYQDSGGNVVLQRFGQESAMYPDRGFQQRARYVDIQFGRFTP